MASFTRPKNTFARITSNDFQTFATAADSRAGPFLTTLSLYGFWNQMPQLPKDTQKFWWVFGVMMTLLTVTGLILKIKKGDPIAGTLAVSGIIGLIIGMGMAHPISAKLVLELAKILPGFKGLRETEKALGLLALAYALGAPAGIRFIAGIENPQVRNKIREFCALGCILLIPLVSMVLVPSGFVGNIPVSEYPAGWYQARTLLTYAPTPTTLVLPWHGYLAFPFTEFTRVANPAPVFFPGTVITGTKIENGSILDTFRDPWDRVIFSLMHDPIPPEKISALLRNRGVTHIVILKTVDWEPYARILSTDPHAPILFEDESLTMYQIQKP